ncbi:leucine-rich repeat receptor-like protein kinase TDR [Olea europaea var. sylvestris]|uniref:leucine-rich repeat receptor-like protein kinase TDR n=1 Tax=Olea europaea var. sylvestris TaxID=158386 RepID=UPI000C1D8ACD|nr:leucine-rich repeat receptor-like protein kinase TDR [Olea europaea var. sylvestris]
MQFPMGILRSLYYLTIFAVSSMFMATVLASDPLSDALLSFESEIIDDSNSLNDWIVPSGVNSSGKILACSWTGVKCSQDSSKIVGLDLSKKNLRGSLSGKQFNLFVDLVDLNLSHNSLSDKLPAGISSLTNLKSLDISRNNFSGHFPSGFSKFQNLVVLDAFSNSFSGPLPADISEIQSLKVLNFAGSYFRGPIPSEYGSFKNLEFIHLAGNSLSGNIPPDLGKLKTLSHMEIGYNRYEGGIPWQFGNMSELKYLDIADANLYGSIPKQICNLTKLESLFLFSNQLTGLIPWEFSNILPLKSMDLSDNLLFGQIPDSFSELKNLRLLSLMYNNLDGFVPEGIAKLPQLDTLLLWNNNFSGSLPQDLGRYSKVKYVDVSTNKFVGSIPTDICSGGELMKLILFSNNFTEGLYPSLSNCSSLVRVRLEDNSFSGDISLKFSNLPDLSYLDLSRNRFTGGIPTDIDQASGLQYFNMSNNPALGGIIPLKTWSLPLLENFSVVSCSISGNIPPFQHCKSLSVIELSTNKFSGIVPESISNCKELVSIDLANNNLAGPIPLEMAKLPAIGIIDMSRNSFSGPIPAEFGNSSTLKLLNVSYNDIWGLIPPQRTFRLMDRSAFFGNLKLCGAPLRPCHHENVIPNGLDVGSRRTQKLAWILIICAAIVLFITTAVFGILYFKRGSKGQWKMVAFRGLPQFNAKDVLRSFNSVEVLEEVPAMPDSICKVVLPTGITVSVKKIEWEPKRMEIVLQFLHRMGNARHSNLTRLLGICYNSRLAYLLYDYLPNGNLSEKTRMKRDWPTKYKMVIGIARGLCFLHHDCYPAIPHGNLKASNIMFDENMEPRLVEYGLKSIVQLTCPLPAKITKETGKFGTSKKEELYMDIYNFGEIILEVLTNGRLVNAASSIHNTPKEILIREITNENDIDSSNSFKEEIKRVLDVALLCTTSRPSMEDALKMLSGLKPQTNGNGS